jgi:hypothetical protein
MKQSAAVNRPLNRDRLMLVPRDTAMKGALSLLDRIQDEAPETAMAAAAVLFAAFCKRCRIDAQEAHRLALRMLTPEPFHQKANIQSEVVEDFAGLRMAGQAINLPPEGATMRERRS